MKLTEIEQFWPILEAIKAGKTIQVLENGSTTTWFDATDCLMFNMSPDNYRIKPEKKKALKKEIQCMINPQDEFWGVPKEVWNIYWDSTHVGSPLTLYIDVETKQFIDPKNLGEYDVQE